MPDTADSATPPPWTSYTTLICVGLVALEAVVFARVTGNGFVNWDDPQYVYQNQHVAAGLTWDGVKWAFTSLEASNWHPLTWLSHMADVSLYGMRAGGHHLTSLLLHMAATLVLFDAMRTMTGSTARSAFVAALFGVHPTRVESVAWVAERKDVLSALFWMLTVRAYVAYARDPRPRRQLAVVACFAAGLMSKPMLVTLPFVLLLLDLWPLRRIRLTAGADSPSPTEGDGRRRDAKAKPATAVELWPQRSAWQLVREKTPLFALVVVSCVVTLYAQRGAVMSIDALPVGGRVQNALVAYVAYLGKAVWPTDLAAFYPFPTSLPAWKPALAAAALAIVTFLVVRQVRRRPCLAVGWLWYLGTLAPVIGLVQVGRQSMADRYTYIPFVGLFLVSAWGLPELAARVRPLKLALPAAAVAAVALCAVAARAQVPHWKDTRALWERALASTRENELAHSNLGALLVDAGPAADLDAGIAQLEAALRIAPDYVDAHNNLGHALRKKGDLDLAIFHLREAIRLKPDCAPAHDNIGLALREQGKLDDAVLHFREAVRIQSDYAGAHYDLGLALNDQGKSDEAVREVALAVRLEPAHPDWRHALGVLYMKSGDLGRAVAEFRETLRLDPRHDSARRALEDLTGQAPR